MGLFGKGTMDGAWHRERTHPIIVLGKRKGRAIPLSPCLDGVLQGELYVAFTVQT